MAAVLQYDQSRVAHARGDRLRRLYTGELILPAPESLNLTSFRPRPGAGSPASGWLLRTVAASARRAGQFGRNPVRAGGGVRARPLHPPSPSGRRERLWLRRSSPGTVLADWKGTWRPKK